MLHFAKASWKELRLSVHVDLKSGTKKNLSEEFQSRLWQRKSLRLFAVYHQIKFRQEGSKSYVRGENKINIRHGSVFCFTEENLVLGRQS